MNLSAQSLIWLAVAWLFAAWPAAGLDWQHFPGGRSAELAVPAAGRTGFQRLGPEITRVFFTNQVATDRHLTNQILLNGAGVALGDVDGDGWCDVYLCNFDGPNALFRNRGNWKFENVTEHAGVAGPNLDATGAALADVDGDGDLDLLVNSLGGGTHLFLNDGRGRFRSAGPAGGLNPRRGGSSLALADADGDGDLDLYVANYRTVTIRDQPNTRFTVRTVNGQPTVTAIDGRPTTDPELANRFTFRIRMGGGGQRGSFAHEEHGEADVYFRNEGGGRFQPVSFTDGTFLDDQGRPLTKPPFDWGLSVMFRDLNGDGAPDLYVCNDLRSPDRLWLNDGRGRFRAAPPLALRQMCLSSMGVDVADINRDGHDDLFVLDMLARDHGRRFSQRIDIAPEVLPPGAIDHCPQYPRNMLYLNRGDGTYAEIAQWAGLDAAEWAWTPVFLDVDLDGYEDLLVANGFERDNMSMDVVRRLELLKKEKPLSSVEQLRLRRLFPRLEVPNLAFRNRGNLQFEEMGAAWGFNTVGIAQGMALADLDNDGDLDVVVNNFNAAAGMYRNETTAPRVTVRLRGRPPNTRGVGARIRLLGGPVAQSQQMICGGRYLSSDEPVRTFAARGTGEFALEVTWRSGHRTRIAGIRPNRVYEIDEAAPNPTPAGGDPAIAEPPPLFQDVSEAIRHAHHEEAFDDFARQPLLPNRLSQLGPGVAWFDLDGDGWDDLLVGSGRGGRPGVFRNRGNGRFERWENAPFDQPVTRDQTTILGWRNGAGQSQVLAGSANYEDGLTNGGVAHVYDPAGPTVQDFLPGQAASTGPLALADIDGDGDLDLFVGGRVTAGRYPEAASSLIFRNAGGKMTLDETRSRALREAGLVSGAVFSDLDADGDPDLALACEWGPVRVFRNEPGAWTDVTEAWGFGGHHGWWNGIAAGDFDGDGRLDLVASNWGRNTKYESFRGARGLRLRHGDFDGDAVVEVLEAYFSPERQALLPLQPFHQVAAAIPALRERCDTYAAYARGTLAEIHGRALEGARELQANWLDSTIFLNRGARFEARPLPVEAQMAPAFAVCVADFDGDGAEDVFLSQNFFATQLETSRYDAGLGLWLKGDGRGGFVAVPADKSGLRVYGEQRGAAVCDFDADGRADLAIAQNAAGTKLFRNTQAKPGLRVRLLGPPGNPSAVGAVLQLESGGRWGPARELHAGAGYWSQDSAVQVLPAAEAPTKLRVRWPGGKTTVSDVPPDAREIGVETTGAVKVVR